MQFIEELYRLLGNNSFKLLQKNRTDIWLRDDMSELSLLYIIPEKLPGQHERLLSDVRNEQNEIGNQLMIRTGRTVQWLTLLLFKQAPDREKRNEIDQYHNIWCISREDQQLLIYENQIGEYCGLSRPIEEFLTKYDSMQKKSQINDIRRMFTPVNTTIVLACIAVFIVLSMMGDVTDANFMAEHGALYGEAVMQHGEYYRLFTSMFIHFGADHLLQNMMILLIMGCRLEKITGRWKYIIIYFVSGIAASIASLIITLSGEPYTVSGGASGAIFGVLGGVFALIVKDMITGERKRIRDIGLTGIIFMIASALSYGFFETGVDNAAHVGGLIAGFIISIILV